MTITIPSPPLSRRTLLRGAGAAIALPLLDAMRPAVAADGDASPTHRVAVVYVPNGIVMDKWLPTTTGRQFTFPRILKPLESMREHITVVSGLENTASGKAQGGAHAKASGSFLSGMPPKFTAGPDVRAGITFDQVAAHQWAARPRGPSAAVEGSIETSRACA